MTRNATDRPMSQGEMSMSARSQPESRWIRTLHSTSSARLRLVCLPHAGGVAGFFRDWSGRLPGEVELWAVQYPGRENRIGEPLIPDMHSLAEHVTDELRPFLDLPTVIFGHSMGAAVGYEVVRRLTMTDEHHFVRHLLVSGCAAPHRIRPFTGHEEARLLDDDQLVAMLRALGAGGSELLDDPEMRSVVLPAIRNDYGLIQAYQSPRGRPRLRTAITAFAGRDDAAVHADDLRAWAQVTQGRFEARFFPGGHFYLMHRRDQVIRAVTHVLNTSL
ncbi:thioesterase II family protein [Streptomyces syringium]|uniref:thioesterase II family protein n=1 Tax=Streptomyces syringium TaxID=76729 RepID=UPI003448D166